jgi:hypothetical protein
MAAIDEEQIPPSGVHQARVVPIAGLVSTEKLQNPREMMRFSIVGGKESEGLINNDEEPFIDGLIRIVEGQFHNVRYSNNHEQS